MKGLTLTSLILIIVVLVLTASLFVPVLFGTADESAKQSTRLTAQHIAGIINMLEASPSIAMHTVELPGMCTINIDTSQVTVSMEKRGSVVPVPLGKVSGKAGIIKTSADIRPISIECKNTGRAYFMRCLNKIEISEKPLRCEV